MEDDLDDQIRRKRSMIEKLKKENEDIEKKIKEKTKEKEEKNQEIKKLQDELDNLKKTTNNRNEEYIRNKKDIKEELIEAIINEFNNLYEDENKDIKYYKNGISELKKKIDVIKNKIEKEKNKE
jgi:chromosome segregation ATPase